MISPDALAVPPARPRVQCAGSLGSGPMNWRYSVSSTRQKLVQNLLQGNTAWFLGTFCFLVAHDVYRKVARVSSPFECKYTLLLKAAKLS